MAAAPARAGEQNPAYRSAPADTGGPSGARDGARAARAPSLRPSDAPRPRRPARALSRSASAGRSYFELLFFVSSPDLLWTLSGRWQGRVRCDLSELERSV